MTTTKTTLMTKSTTSLTSPCSPPQLQNYTSSVGEGEQRAEAAEKRLADLQASWDEQKKMLAAESKKKEARCADLVNQNSVLHGQLEKVADSCRGRVKANLCVYFA